MRGEANLVKWIWCGLILLLATCTAAADKIIYVDDDAVGTNDGSSWVDAFNYLQDALITASAGDEIRVAQGIYTPDRGIGIMPGDCAASFQLINGVTIKGGFAGFGEPDPNAYDSEVYKTILNGDLKGNDVEMDSPSRLNLAVADNSCCVILADSTDDTAVLDSCTITGSYGKWDVCEIGRSGDMVIKAGSPTIRNCHFTRLGYFAFSHGGISRGGGADSLLIYDASKPTITNCRFTDNGTGAVGSDSSPIFIDCIFEDNGYALSVEKEAAVSVTNCEFLDNIYGIRITDAQATLTGCTFERTDMAGVTSTRSTLVVIDCDFAATKEYSAIRVFGGDVTLERCVFNSNTGIEAGAINFFDGNLVASYCVFRNNRSGNYGGAISSGGSLDLRNCHFSGNYSAFEGGALASDGVHPIVASGCTFTGNTAEYGGAISYYGPSIVVSNCTFADNRGFGTAIFALGGTGQNIELNNCIIWNSRTPFQPDGWILPKVKYSDVEGGWPSVGRTGIGNINVEPCFADPGYWDPNGTPEEANDDFWVDGDYHLKSQAGRWDSNEGRWTSDDVTSPCIDTGNPNMPVGAEPEPNGGIINMGAYGGTPEASLSPWQRLLGQASNPEPADGAVGVYYRNVKLSWTPGLNAVSHNVYFGSDVNGLALVSMHQTATEFEIETLEYDTAYYWRIDEVNSDGTTAGEVWTFRTAYPSRR